VNALSKAKIADVLCMEVGLTKPDAKEMVELFYEEIRHALENGQHVKLSGFGNFTLRDKSSRPGRNPKTGEEIPVQARRVVTYKAGLKLKSKVEAKGMH
jgi:integration host factor subunit alpha